MKKLKKPKKSPLPGLKKQLDKVFSLFIRQRDVDENGYGKCVTCPKIIHWREGDCGHYISRTYTATRWDERNASLQCKGCNSFHRGRPDEFAIYILDKYGEETLRELYELKFTLVQMREADYRERIKHYESLL